MERKWDLPFSVFFCGSHSPIPFPSTYKLFAGLMVALSLVLLGLLRSSASLWGTTLYRYPSFFLQGWGVRVESKKLKVC